MSPFFGTLTLVILVALLGAAWRHLLRQMGEGRDGVVAGGVLVTLALADVTGALVADLRQGFAIGVLIVVLTAWASARSTPMMTTTLTTSPSWHRVEYAAAFALATLLAWCALGSWMWDEQSTHLPLAGAAARGVLPLEHPAFPGQPLRYHAGYAVAVGVVRAFSGLPLDLCADVVTVAGVVALVVALRDVLRSFGLGPGHTAVGLVFVVCAGGPLAGLLADGWGAALPGKGLLPAAWVNGATFPPLVVTNVLQHPQGLAMPVALAVLLLLGGRHRAGHVLIARVLMAAVLVVALARIQILFSAFTGLLLLGAVGSDLRTRRTGAVVSVLVAVITGLLALQVGGLGGDAANALVFGAGYFTTDGPAAIVHELLAFGVSLLALPASLWLWRTADRDARRVLLAGCGVLGALGVVVANVAVYSRSWDIVKFFGVGFFFGHVALAVALARLPRPVVAVIVVISCWSGGFWLLRHGPLQGVVAPPARERPLDGFAVAVDDACGPLVPGRARVFSTTRSLWQVGWLVPGTPWQTSRDTMALLLDRPRVDEDVAAWTRAFRALDAETLAGFGADAVVIDDRALPLRQAGLEAAGFVVVCRAAGATVFLPHAGRSHDG